MVVAIEWQVVIDDKFYETGPRLKESISVIPCQWFSARMAPGHWRHLLARLDRWWPGTGCQGDRSHGDSSAPSHWTCLSSGWPWCHLSRTAMKKKRLIILGYLLSLLSVIYQSPGLPGWQKVYFITVTRMPHHLSIAAGLYCLTTSPGFHPALCEKWNGFFYVHGVLFSYTLDQRLKVSSERLDMRIKRLAKGATARPGFELETSGMEVQVLTVQPRQLLG